MGRLEPTGLARGRLGRPELALDEVEPAVLLTYDSDGGYGHPDHVVAHQVAVAAVAAARWRTPRVLAVFRPTAATRAAFARFTAPAGYLTAEAGDVGELAEIVDPCCPTGALGPRGASVGRRLLGRA